MSTKFKPPHLENESVEAFDQFLSQFHRYLRVAEPEEERKLDILLLSIGNKFAAQYDEITWPAITEVQKKAGVTEFSRAVDFLRSKFMADKNVLCERMKLYSHKQLPDQSLCDFVSDLRRISRYCDFPVQFADESLRDAFCLGLLEDDVRKAVCREFAAFYKTKRTFHFEDAIKAAEVEKSASKTAATTSQLQSDNSTYVASTQRNDKTGKSDNKRQCYWCGSQAIHGRKECPAYGKSCRKCNGEGHFASVCRKNPPSVSSTSIVGAVHCSSSQRKFIAAKINDSSLNLLVDSGSDVSILTKSIAERLHLRWHPPKATPPRSVDGSSLKIIGMVNVALELDSCFINTEFLIADQLHEQAILGMSTLQQFEGLHLTFRGKLPTLNVAGIQDDLRTICDKPSTLKIQPVTLFNLPLGTAPIRAPSRYRSREDNDFIRSELKKLADEGVIIASRSPWRSQVIVAKDDNHKKRMVIDYASTVNRFTTLDAFPVPLISDVLSRLHGSSIFSRLDMRSAYYQVPIPLEDQPITAFEADGELWQFTKLPFGVTNGVATFCRVLKDIVGDLEGVVHYFDDIVICAKDQVEHDKRLGAFIERAKEFNLTLNFQKCTISANELTFLGHSFKDGQMAPDRNRLAPLLDFPLPKTMKELERFIGLTVYYSKWIPNYAETALPLFEAKVKRQVPLPPNAVTAATNLKASIAKASLAIPTGKHTLVLETDASSVSIGGVLTENSQPVCFFSHKLTSTEQKWSAVELEAFAIVSAVDHMRQYLLGRHFQLLTDQQGVSFLFDSRPRNKIKNSKINRWRVELAEYSFDITYRPGATNSAADALSRVSSVANEVNVAVTISTIHDKMGHPGVQRMCHYLSDKFGITGVSAQVSQYVGSCELCARQKPKFPKVPLGKVIRSTRPWQRLSIDFVGPKNLCGGKAYIFTIIDEFTRFPFAFSVAHPSTQAAIHCLESLFTLFGPPSCIHSDRGASFESRDFLSFLSRWNVAKSRTTPYHPEGNGQCERFNGLLWRTIQLRLAEEGKPQNQWAEELHKALMNIRALPSRALGFQSPHDLFCAFARRSTLNPIDAVQTNGEAMIRLPDWLVVGNLAFAKRHVRNTKDDPLVDQVTILELISPYVARVKFSESGREVTVSTRHLSRHPQGADEPPPQRQEDPDDQADDLDSVDDDATTAATDSLADDASLGGTDEEPNDLVPPLQRPRRRTQVPARLSDFVLDDN